MFFLVSVRLRYQERIGPWTRALRALQMLLRACSLLVGSGLPFTEDFTGRAAGAGRLNRALSRSALADAIPDLAEYTNWFLAAEVRHYFHTLGLVFGQREFLRDCYRLCAELEADVALACHLQRAPTWCWADRSGQRTLQLEAAVHPLLDAANPLSIALDGKGAFLSGQNGVGKSTFLRTLGLNLAAARAFGFCYAAGASLPALPVVASMQNEDSLLGGQSLYIAELARARALLAAARARPVICLVDEIFRGTNHEEAVSAAAAVVDELAGPALVVVSSHNLVLGSLLGHRLAPWRIEQVSDGRLRLGPGLLGRTNGVALLAAQGFDGAVQRKAEQVAAWLAGHRHAGDGAAVLAAPSRVEQAQLNLATAACPSRSPHDSRP
jgi:DNA mismatch repair ATPase MutS